MGSNPTPSNLLRFLLPGKWLNAASEVGCQITPRSERGIRGENATRQWMLGVIYLGGLLTTPSIGLLTIAVAISLPLIDVLVYAAVQLTMTYEVSIGFQPQDCL